MTKSTLFKVCMSGAGVNLTLGLWSGVGMDFSPAFSFGAALYMTGFALFVLFGD